MTYDEDLVVFALHFDWWTYKAGEGYVPTDAAPDYAREAMKRWNERH